MTPLVTHQHDIYTQIRIFGIPCVFHFIDVSVCVLRLTYKAYERYDYVVPCNACACTCVFCFDLILCYCMGGGSDLSAHSTQCEW